MIRSKINLLTLAIVFFSLIWSPSVFAQSDENPALYSLKFLKQSIRSLSTLWDSPEAVNRNKKKVTTTISKRPSKSSRTSSTQQQSLISISSTNTAFRVNIDPAFKKTSDSLTVNGGQLILASPDTKITVQATNQTCNSTGASYQECYRKLWTAAQSKLRSEYRKTSVLENKDVVWHYNILNPQSQNRNNTGRLLLLNNNGNRIGQFLFFEPETNFIWSILAEGPAKGVLKNTGSMQELLLNLFAEPKTENTRRQQNAIDRSTLAGKTSSRSRSSKGLSVYTQNNQQLIKASDVDFEIEVPRGFEVIGDDLSADGGALRLENLNGVLEIRGTTEVCESQTPRLVNKCIETKSQQSAEKLKVEDPELWLLEDRNYFFSFLTQDKSHEDFGSLHLYRKADQRRALFGFLNPINNHLWEIYIEAPEHKESLLNDNQKIKSTFGSIRFKLPQE